METAECSRCGAEISFERLRGCNWCAEYACCPECRWCSSDCEWEDMYADEDDWDEEDPLGGTSW